MKLLIKSDSSGAVLSIIVNIIIRRVLLRMLLTGEYFKLERNNASRKKAGH